MGSAGHLFDAFGTLVRIAEPRGAYQQLFSGVSIGLAERRELVLTHDWSMRQFAERYGCLHNLSLAEQALREELASIELIDGPALDSLHHAVAKGRPVGVISNLAQPYAAPVIALLPSLTAYVWSFAVGVAKPDQRIFRLGAERLGLLPQEIVMYGDSQRADINGAEAVGMKAVYVGRNRTWRGHGRTG